VSPQKPLNARSISDRQIRALRAKSAQNGDLEILKICEKALKRRGGRGDCADAINLAADTAWADGLGELLRVEAEKAAEAVNTHPAGAAQP
jgi:hypothetical protein